VRDRTGKIERRKKGRNLWGNIGVMTKAIQYTFGKRCRGTDRGRHKAWKKEKRDRWRDRQRHRVGKRQSRQRGDH
jgi:hypothetical protein